MGGSPDGRRLLSWKIRAIPSPDASSARTLEDDDGDLPVGLFLVGGEVRDALLLGLPDPRTFLTFGYPGDRIPLLGPDLDRDLRVRLQVVVPVGVGGSTALRSEH